LKNELLSYFKVAMLQNYSNFASLLDRVPATVFDPVTFCINFQFRYVNKTRWEKWRNQQRLESTIQKRRV